MILGDPPDAQEAATAQIIAQPRGRQSVEPLVVGSRPVAAAGRRADIFGVDDEPRWRRSDAGAAGAAGRVPLAVGPDRVATGGGVTRAAVAAARHTFVTLALDRGVPLTAIAACIGDTEETVARTYAHAIPGAEAAAVDAVAAALRAAG